MDTIACHKERKKPKIMKKTSLGTFGVKFLTLNVFVFYKDLLWSTWCKQRCKVQINTKFTAWNHNIHLEIYTKTISRLRLGDYKLQAQIHHAVSLLSEYDLVITEEQMFCSLSKRYKQIPRFEQRPFVLSELNTETRVGVWENENWIISFPCYIEFFRTVA